jgi:hypothetical protein
VEGLDNGKQIDGVLIDFSEAFDRVIIMEIVGSLGLDGRAVRWIYSFISGRTPSVKNGDIYSEEYYAESAVPQGSVFGSILIVINVSHINRYVESPVRMFADDFIIYRETAKVEDGEIMQNDLKKFKSWAIDNGMIINADKTN